MTTTSPDFSIIPKHVYEKSIAEDPTMARSEYHTDLEDHPVVGGPYELSRRVRNQEFVVRRRENYYMHDGKQVRPKPHFKEIRTKAIEDLNTALLALKAGQIEEMLLRPEHWFTQANGRRLLSFEHEGSCRRMDRVPLCLEHQDTVLLGRARAAGDVLGIRL